MRKRGYNCCRNATFCAICRPKKSNEFFRLSAPATSTMVRFSSMRAMQEPRSTSARKTLIASLRTTVSWPSRWSGSATSAMRNLNSGGANPSRWAKVAASNLEHLSRSESKRILADASQGAGLAIVLGNILDTIPACLVIGAKFVGVETLSISSSECSWVGSPRQRRVLRRLRNLGTIQEIAKLQRERKAAGLSARTINYEIHTLRGILKHLGSGRPSRTK